MRDLPDVLVCGGGGTLGEAWMRGLLNGLEEASGLDFRGCGHFLGTSAGSIVCATLATGHRPRAGEAAARAWASATASAPPAGAGGGTPRASLARRAARAGGAAAVPLAPLGLALAAPGGAVLRRAALAAVPDGHNRLDRLAGLLDRLDGGFDGRLRVAAVDRGSGRRVIFGAPEAPAATVRDAVLASCAIPGVFAPLEIGGRTYVDGGVWSPTNLDAAPAGRGGHVLCLIPTAGSDWRTIRAATSAATTAEVLALRARGALVRTVAPDDACMRAMGRNLMDARRSEAVLTAAYAQGRSLA